MSHDQARGEVDFRADRARDAFASRMPRAYSTITAAATCSASCPSPECVRRPFTAAL